MTTQTIRKYNNILFNADVTLRHPLVLGRSLGVNGLLSLINIKQLTSDGRAITADYNNINIKWNILIALLLRVYGK